MRVRGKEHPLLIRDLLNECSGLEMAAELFCSCNWGRVKSCKKGGWWSVPGVMECSGFTCELHIHSVLRRSSVASLPQGYLLTDLSETFHMLRQTTQHTSRVPEHTGLEKQTSQTYIISLVRVAPCVCYRLNIMRLKAWLCLLKVFDRGDPDFDVIWDHLLLISGIVELFFLL